MNWMAVPNLALQGSIVRLHLPPQLRSNVHLTQFLVSFVVLSIQSTYDTTHMLHQLPCWTAIASEDTLDMAVTVFNVPLNAVAMVPSFPIVGSPPLTSLPQLFLQSNLCNVQCICL